MYEDELKSIIQIDPCRLLHDCGWSIQSTAVDPGINFICENWVNKNAEALYATISGYMNRDLVLSVVNAEDHNRKIREIDRLGFILRIKQLKKAYSQENQL